MIQRFMARALLVSPGGAGCAGSLRACCHPPRPRFFSALHPVVAAAAAASDHGLPRSPSARDYHPDDNRSTTRDAPRNVHYEYPLQAGQFPYPRNPGSWVLRGREPALRGRGALVAAARAASADEQAGDHQSRADAAQPAREYDAASLLKETGAYLRWFAAQSKNPSPGA